MSNVLNHNKNIFDIRINRDNYFDFHLVDNYNGASLKSGHKDNCMIMKVDFNNPNCIWFDEIFSEKGCKWSKAINNGVNLSSIGYTGVDNGLISFKKDETNNKTFLNLYTNSNLMIEPNDTRLKLRKINGNNQVYDYTIDIVEKDNMIVSRLNGGFYQGFFKTKCKEYQILPDTLDNGWTLSFELNKCRLKNTKTTLNSTHHGNEGIFFYIGTRAENKWWKFYRTERKYEHINGEYNTDGYMNKDYTDVKYNVPYNTATEDKKPSFFSGSYVKYDENCCETDDYFKDGYVDSSYEKPYDREYFGQKEYLDNTDEVINKNMSFECKEGYDMYQPNIFELRTDNKFITFNATKDGYNIDNNGDNEDLILYDIKKPNLENYFTLFNATKNGYNIESIEKLIKEKNKHYDIVKDITNNALCFRITDDGRIGYRYIVSGCNDDGYEIKEKYTDSSIIQDDKWYSLSVVIKPIMRDMMVISIYCDGRLKLVSETLPILKLRELDDLYSKQEGVPYNISIGGGTQGLSDVIYHDFRNLPEYILPLEKYFAGTFVGYIKEFEFYDCPLSFNEINQ